MKRLIEQWRQAYCNYEDGCAILTAAGMGALAAQLLEQGPSIATRDQLADEISNIESQSEKQWLGQKSNQHPVVGELKEKAVTLMRERTVLHASLSKKIRIERRREIATRIKAITAELDMIYSDVEYIEEVGTPRTSAQASGDELKKGVMLVLSRDSIRARMSQLKKQNTPEPILSQWKEKLSHVERRIKQIVGK